MVELRHAGAPDETADDRARLRAIAEQFPGALRELDTLATDELTGRGAALEAAADGGPVEPWMAWMHAYHALMRLALQVKRGRRVSPEELAQAGVDDGFVAEVKSPPHGRMMVVVFRHLGTRFSVTPAAIWDTLFPTRKGTRSYR